MALFRKIHLSKLYHIMEFGIDGTQNFKMAPLGRALAPIEP